MWVGFLKIVITPELSLCCVMLCCDVLQDGPDKMAEDAKRFGKLLMMDGTKPRKSTSQLVHCCPTVKGLTVLSAAWRSTLALTSHICPPPCAGYTFPYLFDETQAVPQSYKAAFTAQPSVKNMHPLTCPLPFLCPCRTAYIHVGHPFPCLFKKTQAVAKSCKAACTPPPVKTTR
jgi:hypothetical protein